MNAQRTPMRDLLNREEGGSTTFVIMAMGAGLFLLMPFFLNIASEYITRRTAQTAADAAALAAAQTYAEALTFNQLARNLSAPHNDDYRGTDIDGHGGMSTRDCTPDKGKAINNITRAYIDNILNQAPSRVGPNAQSNASNMAADNGGSTIAPGKYEMATCQTKRCQKGSFWGAQYGRIFSVIGQKTYVPALAAYLNPSERNMQIPAKASAELYSKQVIDSHGRQVDIGLIPQDCPLFRPSPIAKPVDQYLYWLRVDWGVDLVQYQGSGY